MGGVSCSKIRSRHCEAVASSAMAAPPQLLSESAIWTWVHELATRIDEDKPMSTRWYSSECWMPSSPLPVMMLSRITTPTSAMKDQG